MKEISMSRWEVDSPVKECCINAQGLHEMCERSMSASLGTRLSRTDRLVLLIHPGLARMYVGIYECRNNN